MLVLPLASAGGWCVHWPVANCETLTGQANCSLRTEADTGYIPDSPQAVYGKMAQAHKFSIQYYGDYLPLQHLLAGSYNRDGVCLLRGTDWIFIYRQFNIQQFHVLPTQCIYVFCVDLRTNSDYFPIQH